MRTAAVILAAGASTRFGSPKQLATVDGATMLERVVALARASGLSPIIAVLPSSIEPPPGAVAVHNDHAAEGLSRSLRLGIAAVPEDAQAAVILLGDQPTVAARTIAALLAKGGQLPIVATRSNRHVGPPVLLRREAFGLVEEATGDEGLAPVLARHAELVTHLDVPAHAPDVDTPADLEAIRP